MVADRLIARVACTLPLLTALVLWGAPAGASEVPPPLAPVTTADAQQLVSVVEVDFDGDGDLDVIASDRALQLHVWVNDGTGHLTQREPLRSTAWRPVPATPSFDDRPIAADSFTQSDSPSVGLGSRTVTWALNPAASAVAVFAALPSAAECLTRTSRAPPLSISLS